MNKLSPEDEEEIKREIKDIYDIMIKDKEIYKSIEKKIVDEKVITRWNFTNRYLELKNIP